MPLSLIRGELLITFEDTPAELGKRLAIFGVSGVAGSMFLGILQAALYENLNGAGGLDVSISCYCRTILDDTKNLGLAMAFHCQVQSPVPQLRHRLTLGLHQWLYHDILGPRRLFDHSRLSQYYAGPVVDTRRASLGCYAHGEK